MPVGLSFCGSARSNAKAVGVLIAAGLVGLPESVGSNGTLSQPVGRTWPPHGVDGSLGFAG
jgi:hypothetical protein